VQENNNIPPQNPPQKSSLEILEIRKVQARENAMQTDEIVNAIVDQFFGEEKLRNFVLSTGLLAMHRIRQVLLTNKQYYDGKEQQIGLQTSTHYLRMVQAYDTVAGTLGFGNQKGGLTVAIQNNNIGSQPPTQNIPLEVATQEEADEIRKELFKQVK